MATIGFGGIPNNLRVPGTYFEFNPSRNNGGTQNLKAVIFGQVLAGSPWAAAGIVNQPALCLGTAAAKAGAGYGSMLALMVERFRARYDIGELWVMPLADDAASVAATGTVTLSGTATAAGTLPLYIDARLVSVLVTAGMTGAQVATAALAAMALQPDLPVTATVTAGALNLAAKNKGAAGNDLDVRVAYRGTLGGEAVPAGLTVAVTPMAGGTTNPALPTVLLNLADLPFEVIVSPYTDSGSLDAFRQLMDESTGRWSWARKLYGHVYAAKAANLSVATTFGVTRNDPHVSVLPINGCPLSPPEIAADYAAAIMESVASDPSVPLQYLGTNIPAPPPAARFARPDRQVLLFDGLSTYRSHAGLVQLERMITTYQVNPGGAPDDSYLDCETMHTLGAACRDMDAFLVQKFLAVGMKLTADDTRIPGGVRMTTPRMIKAAVDTRYAYQCDTLGICQDAAGFAKESRAELAGGGRVNIYAPFRVMGQLRQMAMQVAFNKPT